MASYPEMIPYIMSTESLAKAVLGEKYQTPEEQMAAATPEYNQDYYNQDYLTTQELGEFTPALIRQIMGHFYANQQLGAGATQELHRIYDMSGRTEGYEQFMEAVQNSFALQR